MFHITVTFHMADTVHINHDNPAEVIASLRMSAVRSIEITTNKGD